MKSSTTPTLYTFVQEGTTFATNFSHDPNRKLVAINVSQCVLLEINNRDAENKRTVMSLSHFMKPQLENPELATNSVKTILNEFALKGGRPNNIQFRVYGGVQGENDEIRSNLKLAILRIFPQAIIQEPKGHESKRLESSASNLFGGSGGESTDYIFEHDAITFRKTLPQFGIEEYKDEFSKNLKNPDGRVNKDKVDRFQETIDNEWAAVKNDIIPQTISLERKIASALPKVQEMQTALTSKLESLNLETNPNKDEQRKMYLEYVVSLQPFKSTMTVRPCDSNGLFTSPTPTPEPESDAKKVPGATSGRG